MDDRNIECQNWQEEKWPWDNSAENALGAPYSGKDGCADFGVMEGGRDVSIDRPEGELGGIRANCYTDKKQDSTQ